MPKCEGYPMEFVPRFLLWSLLFVGSASAQELVSIKVEPAEITVGKQVAITVDLKASTVVNGACGLIVNFGDGTVQQIRAENSNLPIRLTRTYANAGPVSVTAEGKLFARGLSSVLGCFGKNQSIAINVRAEDPSEREAAEIAAKNEAVKRAATDRKAAEVASKAAAADRAAVEAAAKTTKSERVAAEAAAEKARTERTAADNAAKKAAVARTAAEQGAAKPVIASPAPTPGAKPPGTAVATPPTTGPTTPVAPSTKPPPPKPKSSLDL